MLHNPVYGFMIGLGSIIEALPEHLQNVAKQKCSNAVLEVESFANNANIILLAPERTKEAEVTVQTEVNTVKNAINNMISFDAPPQTQNSTYTYENCTQESKNLQRTDADVNCSGIIPMACQEFELDSREYLQNTRDPYLNNQVNHHGK